MKRALTTDITRSALPLRLAVTFAALFTYFPVFVALQSQFGSVAAALGVLPGLVGGWSLGVRGGLATTVLLVATNTAVLLAGGSYDPRAGLPGIAMLFAVAALAGWARALYIGVRRRADDAETMRESSERMGRELRRSYESLDAVLESAPIQLAQLDAHGVITSFRGSPLAGIDLAADDLVGRSLLELQAEHPELPHLLRRALLGETVVATVRTGERYEHVRLTPVTGPEGAVRGVNAVSLDVTERERALEEARRLASTDKVTGLANRDQMRACGDQALAAAGASAGLLVMDIDGFQDLNDAFGHAFGDVVLRIVGERLSSAVRAGDTVARSGGDSFVVLLPEAGREQVSGTAARIQTILERPIELDGNALEVSASIGSAAAPDDGSTFSDLVKNAELAMYQAKLQRSGHRAYTKDLSRSDPERATLLADLRRAIEQDQLDLEYQPIVSLADGRAAGAEALIRWRHPVRGSVPPSDFIPFVERSVLGRRLTRWVIRRLWHDTRTLAAAAGPLTFALNLSARDLGDPDLMSELTTLSGRLPTGCTLVAEITESDVMADPERAIETLGALRAAGIRVAIDDFGTGYSSLAYLHRLPADELKVDRSFVSRVTTDEKAREIVRATVAIAHALGLKVVGEGAEDEATLGLLRSFGCDRAQGWAIARPMPVERVAAWLFEEASTPRRVPVRTLRREAISLRPAPSPLA
ncbi:MAG: putative bifunctional diguanylate cyclase/phosphodiesterase [Candidatus Limnocylindria bacterium]